ncbi:MAG: hypothetical protein LBG96_00125 [Tannerella sp.]|jgi:ribosomal protein L33|nr:hypothetical protein [Tannerella sp.]
MKKILIILVSVVLTTTSLLHAQQVEWVYSTMENRRQKGDKISLEKKQAGDADNGLPPLVAAGMDENE